jgi:hypothetical protein
MRQDAAEGLPRFIGYDVLVLNTGDDLYRATTAITNVSFATHATNDQSMTRDKVNRG